MAPTACAVQTPAPKPRDLAPAREKASTISRRPRGGCHRNKRREKNKIKEEFAVGTCTSTRRNLVAGLGLSPDFATSCSLPSMHTQCIGKDPACIETFIYQIKGI